MSSPKRPRSFEDYVDWAETQLSAADLSYGHGTDNPRDEAAWLVGASLGFPPDTWDERRDYLLTSTDAERVRERIAARITTRRPAAYLLNEAWFAGYSFYVDERVIVPRSLLGEFILERFEPWIDTGRTRRILDLCTGSGCIAIALAHTFPDAEIDATDISPEALDVARMNVQRHRLESRVHLLQADLFEGLNTPVYDLIVSNPPYVDAQDLADLPAEYQHEPRLALASGQDGLETITRILAQAADHLTPHGVLVAEVGNSHVALAERYPDVPFTWLTNSHGDESVFLLHTEQLIEHRTVFRAPS